MGPCEYLDFKHVVFGKVIDVPSMMVVRKIEGLPTDNEKPKVPIIISQCGEL